MQEEQFTKLKVKNLLSQARPKPTQTPVTPKAHNYMRIMLITTLIGTTIPIFIASISFAIFFIILMTISIASCIKLKTKPSKRILLALIGALLLSTATGCGPLLDDLDPQLLATCQDQNGSCRVGASIGYSVLGISIKQATIEEAMFVGALQTKTITEIGTGYGLVSFTKIIVYGT